MYNRPLVGPSPPTREHGTHSQLTTIGCTNLSRSLHASVARAGRSLFHNYYVEETVSRLLAQPLYL